MYQNSRYLLFVVLLLMSCYSFSQTATNLICNISGKHFVYGIAGGDVVREFSDTVPVTISSGNIDIKDAGNFAMLQPVKLTDTAYESVWFGSTPSQDFELIVEINRVSGIFLGNSTKVRKRDGLKVITTATGSCEKVAGRKL